MSITNKRHVLFVPGLSSPYGARYADTYNALEKEANLLGYNQVVTVCLPGQSDDADSQQGELSLTTAREKLMEEMLRTTLPETTDLRIVAFSFGCTVALSALCNRKWKFMRIRTVLCGPIPLWLSWQIFREGIGRDQMAANTRMVEDRLFFDDLVPVEHLLSQVDSPIGIVAGEDDPFCTPAYIEYLRQFAVERNPLISTPIVIKGLRHTPEPNRPGWTDFVNMALG